MGESLKYNGQREEPLEVVKHEERQSACTSPSLTTHSAEDLRLLIQTYRDVNRHLDSQVESLTDQLEAARNERDAWRNRCQSLSNILKKRKGQAMEDAAVIDSASIDRLCQRFKEEVSTETLERDGISMEALVGRGLTANWFVRSSEVTLLNMLGEGTFGKTYLARWNGANVCVKCIRVDNTEDRVSFFREIEALSALRHPNILPFLGACIEDPDRFWLICEYMSGGTLGRWLYGDQAKPTTMMVRLEKALDIARGMEACQKSTPSILHRDLKSSNVFLDKGGTARIGDFGLARRLNPEGVGSLTGETGTYIYMSPEMIRHEVYDAATDVWSWGVMTCELMTKSLPYGNQYLTPVQVAMGVSEGKLKPWFQREVHPRLTALLDSVLVMDPRTRPSFEVIVTEMQDIVAELKEQVQSEGFMRRFLKI